MGLEQQPADRQEKGKSILIIFARFAETAAQNAAKNAKLILKQRNYRLIRTEAKDDNYYSMHSPLTMASWLKTTWSVFLYACNNSSSTYLGHSINNILQVPLRRIFFVLFLFNDNIKY